MSGSQQSDHNPEPVSPGLFLRRKESVKKENNDLTEIRFRIIQGMLEIDEKLQKKVKALCEYYC